MSVCLSLRLTSSACRSLDAGSRYRSKTGGGRAAGSVVLRAEVRGSTQTRPTTVTQSVATNRPTVTAIYIVCQKIPIYFEMQLSQKPLRGCYQFCCLVNSLPKTVPSVATATLNLGSSAPESSMPTTRLPSHQSLRDMTIK